MKSFAEMKKAAGKAAPGVDACYDFGGALQFHKLNANRSFGENEVVIDKQTGDVMPFFMAVDQGLLTLDTPIQLDLSTGQPIAAGEADATHT